MLSQTVLKRLSFQIENFEWVPVILPLLLFRNVAPFKHIAYFMQIRPKENMWPDVELNEYSAGKRNVREAVLDDVLSTCKGAIRFYHTVHFKTEKCPCAW